MIMLTLMLAQTNLVTSFFSKKFFNHSFIDTRQGTVIFACLLFKRKMVVFSRSFNCLKSELGKSDT
ncbi:MAG: uncharacterized membrane protein YoaT (DUF817 family) [Alteromonadaceae bacterium]|jgi:uncharacterized membrane protein YoaT (DUF817 family)